MSTALHEQLIAAVEQGDLAMLVASPPVAFQRVFVDVTGSVTSALLLSALMQEHELRAAVDGGWYPSSAEACERATGLTRKEQSTARRILRDLGLLQERRTGYPATLQVRIDYDALIRRLINVVPRPSASSTRSIKRDVH
jgi:hypothetical protein